MAKRFTKEMRAKMMFDIVGKMEKAAEAQGKDCASMELLFNLMNMSVADLVKFSRMVGL
jgi:hypothetical protein